MEKNTWVVELCDESRLLVDENCDCTHSPVASSLHSIAAMDRPFIVGGDNHKRPSGVQPSINLAHSARKLLLATWDRPFVHRAQNCCRVASKGELHASIVTWRGARREPSQSHRPTCLQSYCESSELIGGLRLHRPACIVHGLEGHKHLLVVHNLGSLPRSLSPATCTGWMRASRAGGQLHPACVAQKLTSMSYSCAPRGRQKTRLTNHRSLYNERSQPSNGFERQCVQHIISS